MMSEGEHKEEKVAVGEGVCEERNWAEIPQDVLSVIFNKIGAIDILRVAQFVCRPWRQLSFNPITWKMIDMTTLHGDNMDLDLEAMAREAVDRSQGQLEEMWIEYFGSDELLHYVADRSSKLKCLRLISAYGISDEGLAEAVGRLPLLEDLDLTFGSFTGKVCEVVGKACSHIKYLRRNGQGSRFLEEDEYDDDEALAIANNMPELRRLQLVGNSLTNKGLTEILNKCTHLDEFLDLRCCFRVNMNADLKAKCVGRIKDLRLPNDPLDDYAFIAEAEYDGGYGSADDDDFDAYDGYSDIELMYDDMFFDHDDSEEEDELDYDQLF